MNEKVLELHSIDTERELVGSVILSPSNYEDVNWLKPNHFWSEKHERIWKIDQLFKLDERKGRVARIYVVMKRWVKSKEDESDPIWTPGEPWGQER